MDADNFVIQLQELTPSLSYLRKYGYVEEVVQELRESYFIKQRYPILEFHNDDPLMDLISKYDTSSFEIGILSLDSGNYSLPTKFHKILIGFVEADMLVFNIKSKEVEVLDYSQHDRIIFKCAASGEQFLNAMLVLAAFELPNSPFKGALTEKQKKENQDAAISCARLCAETAGIPSEEKIYGVLLGL